MHLQILQGQGPTRTIISLENAKLTASDLVEMVVSRRSACEQICFLVSWIGCSLDIIHTMSSGTDVYCPSANSESPIAA